VDNLSLSLCKKSVFLFLSTPHLILHLNKTFEKTHYFDIIVPTDKTKKKQTYRALILLNCTLQYVGIVKKSTFKMVIFCSKDKIQNLELNFFKNPKKAYRA
jgi:hypothetical protein